MAALSVVMESLELSVKCGHCGWQEGRSLNWLSERRDMNCPTCSGVIVLNTSGRREQIAALRRQVSSLQRQLENTIPAADCIRSRAKGLVQTALTAPKLELSLVHVYRDSSGRSANTRMLTRAAGRIRR